VERLYWWRKNVMKYFSIFETLTKPENSKEDIFKTKKTDSPNFRIGINYLGYPAILINTNSYNQNIQGYKGQNISLSFNQNCTIIGDDDHEKKENLSCIICTSLNTNLHKIFFDICETVYQRLNKNPDPENIKSLTQIIIDLFKQLPNNKKTILGLWGELFLIHASKDPIKTLKAWHSHPRDKYDFYDNNEAVEVKSTIQTSRVHEFSNEQLLGRIEDHYVVSIMTKEVISGGKSVIDMLNELIALKLSNELEQKLKSNLYLTAGIEADVGISEIKFDYEFALKNILYFKVSDIDKIKSVPNSISDIRYKIDLAKNINTTNFSNLLLISNFPLA